MQPTKGIKQSFVKTSVRVFGIAVVFCTSFYILGYIKIQSYYSPKIVGSDELFDEDMKRKLEKLYLNHILLGGKMRENMNGGNRRNVYDDMYERHLKILKLSEKHDTSLDKATKGQDVLSNKGDNFKEFTGEPMNGDQILPSLTTQLPTAPSGDVEVTTDYTLAYEYMNVTEITESETNVATNFIEEGLTSSLTKASSRAQGFRHSATKENFDHKPNVKLFNPTERDKTLLREKLRNLFLRRKQNLRQFCGSRKGWIWMDTMQLLAAPEKDIVVCAVQKAGSTSWHKLIHELRLPDQKWKGDRKANWKAASELSDSAKRRLIYKRQSIRVIAVRHPFARLVSAWNNKFHKSFFQRNGNKSLSSMPGIEYYAGTHEPDTDHIIAFEDLAQYVADVGLGIVDVHFKSIDELCSPCRFPYDYVVKSETCPEDCWFVTEKVNSTLPNFSRHVPAVGELGSSVYESEVTERLNEESRVVSRLFRKVPRATIRVLMELYRDDFKVFGYTFDISTLMAGGYD